MQAEARDALAKTARHSETCWTCCGTPAMRLRQQKLADSLLYILFFVQSFDLENWLLSKQS